MKYDYLNLRAQTAIHFDRNLVHQELKEYMKTLDIPLYTQIQLSSALTKKNADIHLIV